MILFKTASLYKKFVQDSKICLIMSSKSYLKHGLVFCFLIGNISIVSTCVW